MDLEYYKKELLNHTGLPINEEYTLFNDFELFNSKTQESLHFKSFEELLDIEIDGKTIREIIEKKEDIFADRGGRGSGSSKSVAGNSLFSGGREPRGTGDGEKNLLPPAYVNVLTRATDKSVEGTAKAFGKMLLNEGREYAGLIDEQGFAEKYAKGQKTSVVHLERKGAYSIHNHPTKVLNKDRQVAYNAPSGADLRNLALGNGKGTIVMASGNRTGYIIEKGNKFNGKGFVKGMSKAKTTGKGYDYDVDKWLKANQKEYGYKYTKVKF